MSTRPRRASTLRSTRNGGPKRGDFNLSPVPRDFRRRCREDFGPRRGNLEGLRRDAGLRLPPKNPNLRCQSALSTCAIPAGFELLARLRLHFKMPLDFFARFGRYSRQQASLHRPSRPMQPGSCQTRLRGNLKRRKHLERSCWPCSRPAWRRRGERSPARSVPPPQRRCGLLASARPMRKCCFPLAAPCYMSSPVRR